MPGIRKSSIPFIQRLAQIFPGTIGQNFYIPVIWKKVIYGGWGKGLCVPTLNCYACPLAVSSCPVGLIQHFITLRLIPYYVIGLLVGFGMFLGRFFCGWLCPFGLFQDLTYKIKSPKLRLPRWLNYAPYIILAVLVIYIPFITQRAWFCRLCPQGTLEAGLPWILWNPNDTYTGLPMFEGMVGWLYYLKVGILVGFVALFIIIKRPFCRVVCPLGLIMGWFNKLSLMRFSVDDTCNKCGGCKKICPVDICICDDPNSFYCVRCFRCLACDSVHLTTIFGKREPISLVEKQTVGSNILKNSKKLI